MTHWPNRQAICHTDPARRDGAIDLNAVAHAEYRATRFAAGGQRSSCPLTPEGEAGSTANLPSIFPSRLTLLVCAAICVVADVAIWRLA